MKKVYLCMSTDIIQTGHINVIEKAAELGEVTVGVLSDKYVEISDTSVGRTYEDHSEYQRCIKGRCPE